MKLADYLRRQGIRQKDLATTLAVSEAAVSSWLSGRHIPDGRRLAALEEFTGGAVTSCDFVPGSSTRVDSVQPPAGFAEAQAPFASEARALGLDADAIAAAALKKAIGDEKARRWATENREAIEAWHRYFEENDTPLAEYRMF